MKTLPSSEAEEMSESLKGDLWAVSGVYDTPCLGYGRTSQCRGQRLYVRGREAVGRELCRAR